MRRSTIPLLALGALALGALAPANAQSWPTKPVKMVLPYPPGGIVDTAARIVGSKLSEVLGQQFVIENKPGGAATIGMSTAAKSAPDGYTLLVASAGDVTLTPLLMKNLTYDVHRDFAYITTLTDTPTFIGAHAEGPYKTMADLIADAKTKPGKIAISSPGSGVQQLHFEWVSLVAGIKLQHIPYKGGAAAASAVAAGDVPIGALAVASSLGHLKTGRIRILAQMAAKRSSFIPDAPTMQEAGLAGIDGNNWTVLMAPAGVPKPILDKLHAETVKVLALPDVIERLKGGIAFPLPATPEEVTARVRRESDENAVIVKKAGITLE